MTDKPNAKLSEDQVWAILVRLRKIKQGNFDKDNQERIAKDFKIEKKTVSRIHTGKTWESVKQKFDEEPDHRADMLPQIALVRSYDPSVLELIDIITSVKDHFALCHTSPLHYGKFDWIDGIHSVVTDGIIVWESVSLYRLARQIEKTKVNDAPLFARKVNELPTFELAALLTHHPMDYRFISFEHSAEGVVRMTGENDKTVFLQEKYFNLIDRDGFQVYAAGDRTDIVYLTKTRETKHNENVIIHACVATMQD